MRKPREPKYKSPPPRRDRYGWQEWSYHDAAGKLYYKVRRRGEGKNKEYRQTILKGGVWEHKGFSGKMVRPWYRLPELYGSPDLPVFVTEGEKACDAATWSLKDKFATTTCAGGADVVQYADLEPLRGRKVILWPDKDPDGKGVKAMVTLGQRLEDVAASVSIVDVNGMADIPADGWDLADAEGWVTSAVLERIEQYSHPLSFFSSPASPPGRTKRALLSDHDKLMEKAGRMEGKGESLDEIYSAIDKMNLTFDKPRSDDEIRKVKRKAKEWREERGDTADKATTQIHRDIIRILQSGLREREKHHTISQKVIDWLHTQGKFYHTTERVFKKVMFHDSKRKMLLPVQSDGFRGWLSNYLGVNKADKTFSYITGAVETEGLTERSTEIEPAKYFVQKGNTIYMSCGPTKIIKISVDGVSEEDNGCDNVIFPSDSVLKSWEYNSDTAENPFENCRLFNDPTTTAPHGQLLVALWTITMLSNQKTKPPLVLTGAVGSGKTRMARGIQDLFGLPEGVANIVKSGDKDFWVTINAGGLVIFDNVDLRYDWFPDALASAATAGNLLKRELYTNSTNITLRSEAWIIVTSANPTFAGDTGLADRLIVVRLNRREGETSETKLTEEILANRSMGLSWIANTLSIVLRDTAPVPKQLNHRHPDFADFAVRVGRAIGREEDAICALRAAELDKSVFNLQNDSILSVLMQVLTHGPFKGDISALLTKLIYYDAGLTGKLSTRRLGKILDKSWVHLESAFVAKREMNKSTQIYEYAFSKPDDCITKTGCPESESTISTKPYTRKIVRGLLQNTVSDPVHSVNPSFPPRRWPRGSAILTHNQS